MKSSLRPQRGTSVKGVSGPCTQASWCVWKNAFPPHETPKSGALFAYLSSCNPKLFPRAHSYADVSHSICGFVDGTHAFASLPSITATSTLRVNASCSFSGRSAVDRNSIPSIIAYKLLINSGCTFARVFFVLAFCWSTTARKICRVPLQFLSRFAKEKSEKCGRFPSAPISVSQGF